MDKLNWDSIMTEVPEDFHNQVENTLDSLEEKKTIKKFRKKHRLIFVAAAVMLFGGITAGASGLLKWNAKVAENFNASEKLQNDMAMNKVTEVKKASASDNGMTIELAQTIQDDNFLYAAFHVKAPEGIELSGLNLFEDYDFQADGKVLGMSSSFYEGENFTASNEGLYECYIQKDDTDNWSGKELAFTFKNLQGDRGKLDMYTVLEGTWKLNWITDYENTSQTFDISKKFDIAGCETSVEKVVLSPLSITMYFDDASELIEKYPDDLTDDVPYDIVTCLNLNGFISKDGSVIQTDGNGGSFSQDKETGRVSFSYMLGSVIDVDDVAEIQLGTNETPEVGISNIPIR